MDQYMGGKWLIHSIKHHEDNQLQNLEHPRKKILVENITLKERGSLVTRLIF